MTKKIELYKEKFPRNFLTKNQFFECIFTCHARTYLLHTAKQNFKKKLDKCI